MDRLCLRYVQDSKQSSWTDCVCTMYRIASSHHGQTVSACHTLSVIVTVHQYNLSVFELCSSCCFVDICYEALPSSPLLSTFCLTPFMPKSFMMVCIETSKILTASLRAAAEPGDCDGQTDRQTDVHNDNTEIS